MVLCERLQDRVPQVREAAAHGLLRLQSPEDSECEAIAKLCWLAENDRVVSVRKAALRSLAISRSSLCAILSRTRDTSAEVRVAAFEVLQQKVSPMSLSVEQRSALVQTGTKDRDERVQRACENMIEHNWFVRVGEDLRDIARLFDERHEASIEPCIWHLFNRGKLPVDMKFIHDPLNAVDRYFNEKYARLEQRERERPTKGGVALRDDADDEDDEATDARQAKTQKEGHKQQEEVEREEDEEEAEPAFFNFHDVFLWRMWIEFASISRNEAAFEALVPSPHAFEQLTQLRQLDKHGKVAHQLLLIAHFVGRSTDTFGQGVLSSSLAHLLQNLQIGNEQVVLALKRLNELHLRSSDFLRSALELLVEVREPIDIFKAPEAIAIVEEDTREFNELVDKCQRAEKALKTLPPNGKRAAAARRLIEEMEARLEVLARDEAHRVDFLDMLEVRSLVMLECIVRLRRKSALADGMLVAQLEQIVPAALVHPTNAAIVLFAMRCAASLSLLCRDHAVAHLPMFAAYATGNIAVGTEGEPVGENDRCILQLLGLEALFDCLCLYGTGVVDFAGIASGLVHQMKSKTRAIRTCAVEGFAKLFLFQRLREPEFFTPLLIQYFNPNTEDDARLRQCLTFFFRVFCSANEHKMLICYAAEELLELITSLRSKLFRDLNVSHVIRLVAELAFTTDTPSSTKIPHALLAELLLNLINRLSPQSTEANKIAVGLKFCKQAQSATPDVLAHLSWLVESASERVTGADARRSLLAFATSLSGHSE